ncbi:MAG: hypothetical protein ACE5I3_01440 [Phycisphaerae bacterium]
MLRSCLIVTAGLCLTVSAAAQAQRPIQWISNKQQGVARAKRTGLPIMFYVTGSGRSEGSDLEDAQQRAFRDPLVRGIAEERFVPIRLPQSNDNRQMLAQMGAPAGVGLYLAFVTSEGKLIGRIPPGQVAEAKVLARQMTAMFRKYRGDVFQRELKPKLEDQGARPGEVVKALKLIEKFLILEADENVAKLLERDRVSKTVKKQVYGVLAVLSTPRSVKALLEAASRDKLAAQALRRCTPAGAEEMLPALEREKPGQFLIAYEAVAKICNIKGTKPRGFWSGTNEQRIFEEIERVKEEVRKSAKRWRDRFEAYR